MSTQLERELIKELIIRATSEELTPENIEEIKKIVERLERSNYKQAIKDEILKQLGVDRNKYIIFSSISTIFDTLIYLRSIGVRDVEMFVEKFPNVLGLNRESVQRKVEYLQSIGVKDVARLITRFPYLLGLSVENMQEKVRYIQSVVVKNTEKDVGKLIEKHPRLLGYSIEKMQKIIEYLQSIGVNSSKVIKRSPNVLGFSIKKIQKIVRYLQEIGIKNVGKFVEVFPTVLGYSIERIQMKYEYLAEEIGLSAEDIENNPILLILSLEERIVPRWESLKSLGIPLKKGRLALYISSSESEFRQFIKRYTRKIKSQIKRHISEETEKCLSGTVFGRKFKQIEKCIGNYLTAEERLIINRLYRRGLRDLLVHILLDLKKSGKVYYENGRWYLMELRKKYEEVLKEFSKRYEEEY